MANFSLLRIPAHVAMRVVGLGFFAISLLHSCAAQCMGNDSRCADASDSTSCHALANSGTDCSWGKVCAPWCAGHGDPWETKCTKFVNCIECSQCATAGGGASTANTGVGQATTATSVVDGPTATSTAHDPTATPANVEFVPQAQDPESTSDSSSDDLPIIAIAGAVGGGVALCVVLLTGWYCSRRSTRRDIGKKEAANDGAGNNKNDNNNNFELEIEDGQRTDVPATARIPQYWDSKTGDFCSRKDLSNETLQVFQQLLDSTFTAVKTVDRKDGPVPSKLVLVSAQRMENSALWAPYAKAHMALCAKRGKLITPLERIRGGNVKTADAGNLLPGGLDNAVNEVYLWHGTSSKAAESIMRDGFNLDVVQAHGGLYGKGVYMAECSSKSDEYAVQNSDGSYKGIHCMLLCRSTLGEALTLTRGGDKTGDMIQSAMASGYDSVLGDREAVSGTYREFVVYDERRVYPEYVLFYKREMPM